MTDIEAAHRAAIITEMSEFADWLGARLESWRALYEIVDTLPPEGNPQIRVAIATLDGVAHALDQRIERMKETPHDIAF